jgi:signal peptidase I
MSVAPPPPTLDQRPRRRILLWIVLAVTIPIVAFFVIVGLVLHGLGWTAYYQSSSSMSLSILAGDYFFIDRSAYTDGRVPRRGDIIAFYPPAQVNRFEAQRGFSDRVVYVKRIIAVAGDTIALKEGVPVINGKPVEQESVGQITYRARKASVRREHLPGGAVYEILKYQKQGDWDDGGPFAVPAGEYFVLGDDRDDSLDGRGQGLSGGGWWSLPASDIIGRANYVYWSGFERLGRIGVTLK